MGIGFGGLRNKGKDDKTTDPTGDFRRLDALLPKKLGESLEARAREVEGSLDWIGTPKKTSRVQTYKRSTTLCKKNFAI